MAGQTVQSSGSSQKKKNKNPSKLASTAGDDDDELTATDAIQAALQDVKSDAFDVLGSGSDEQRVRD